MTQRTAPVLAFNSNNDTRAHQVHPTDPSKTALVSTSLSYTYELTLIEFLRERWEIFAWCPLDMPGVPREFAEHAL